MYDRDLVIEILRQIHQACLVVMERFNWTPSACS